MRAAVRRGAIGPDRRELFFEGWRALGAHLQAVPTSDDPSVDLREVVQAYRSFLLAHSRLAEVMLGRPFADFDPATEETAVGAVVRELIIDRVQRCIDAGLLEGNTTDIAHVVVALLQGLAGAEMARRLGSTSASVQRCWTVALDAVLRGFAPGV